MTANSQPDENETGFEGAVTGLTLADLIQLKGLNRFSGCLSVEYGRHRGMIFFRDGEVIHAEQGEDSGESAFYRIVMWPGGKFQTEPKIATTSHTIRRSINYLLLEAHRLMDEQPSEAKNLPKEETSGAHVMSEINVRLTPVPGVEYAVVFSHEGQPLNDSSFEAEALAAQGFYLAMTAGRLGKVLGLGPLRSAAVQGKEHHLLLLDSPKHYLAASIQGSARLEAVDTEIRTALTSKKG